MQLFSQFHRPLNLCPSSYETVSYNTAEVDDQAGYSPSLSPSHVCSASTIFSAWARLEMLNLDFC